jgi:hypothetical protein
MAELILNLFISSCSKLKDESNGSFNFCFRFKGAWQLALSNRSGFILALNQPASGADYTL